MHKFVSLKILKRGRTWFQCENERGYSCKLKITKETDNLKQGSDFLGTVKDISIRSKYGVDEKFEVVDDKQPCFFAHERFNKISYEKCKSLGGTWDREAECFAFPNCVSETVESLDDIFSSEKITVEIKAKNYIEIRCDSVDFLGYIVAKAWDRDSGAKLGNGFFMTEGKIDSGGSMKNWTSCVSEGSTFRTKVPKKLLEMYSDAESEDWDIKILEES